MKWNSVFLSSNTLYESFWSSSPPLDIARFPLNVVLPTKLSTLFNVSNPVDLLSMNMP